MQSFYCQSIDDAIAILKKNNIQWSIAYETIYYTVYRFGLGAHGPATGNVYFNSSYQENVAYYIPVTNGLIIFDNPRQDGTCFYDRQIIIDKQQHSMVV